MSAGLTEEEIEMLCEYHDAFNELSAEVFEERYPWVKTEKALQLFRKAYLEDVRKERAHIKKILNELNNEDRLNG